MMIVRDRVSHVVTYALEDGTEYELTAFNFAAATGIIALDIRSATHEVIHGVNLPVGFVPGAWAFDTDWRVINQEAVDAALAIETQKAVAAFDTALTAHLDATAQARRYDNRITCAVRAGYAGPFQAEGAAFALWMDECNAIAYQLLAEVQAGTRPLPDSPQALIDALPAMVWPA